jgi:hypothetical protein
MKKNLPLIVGISLPVVFIIVISIVIFVPSMFVNPQHNFLYTFNNDAYPYNQGYRNAYVVLNAHLASTPVPANPSASVTLQNTFVGDYPPLYLYDVKTGTSHLVTLEEARLYTLDPGPSSPDGYTVNYEYTNSGIFELFGSSGNDSGYFIEKGNSRKKLSGLNATDRYAYSDNLKLLGWVK